MDGLNLRFAEALRLLLTIALLGAVAWFIDSQIPMESSFKALFRIVAAIVCALWLLSRLS